MNEENKKENILEEIERANEAMKVAGLLSNHGFFRDAVSKLYYALLHAIRALLLTKGLEPRRHEGALRLFSLHFVKDGTFESKYAHLFSKLMKYRQEADYNPSYMFTREDFIELDKEVESVIGTLTTYLKEKGYPKER